MKLRSVVLVPIIFLVGALLLSSPAISTAQSSTPHKTRKSAASAKRTSSKKRKKKKLSPRVRRIRQAFVASTNLRPMAKQLLQDRTPAAYGGVEAYARRHAKEDAGALAWLVVAYAHIQDHDYAKAIDPLIRAKAYAGDLGEYVTYYLGTAYMQTGRSPEAISTLKDFAQKYPDSLLVRDADVVQANALLQQGKAQEAVALLEKDRQPVRVDVEWNLGRAYQAAGDNDKAIAIFRNIYLTMPLTGEADLAGAELKKLGTATPAALGTLEERKTRAELLLKGKRYASAAEEYSDLLDQVSPADRPNIQLALASALQRSGRAKDARKVLESLQDTTGEVNAQRL
ncbi:MAG: hypothetical protein DMG68_06665, partial [Acidobacteria bacterium]